MKLLFDANLSPRLVKQLEGLFPGSVHLFDLPLSRDAEDRYRHLVVCKAER
ncbi:MAG: DUF5615 family PIN-like protein, partial [Bryobacteraceae bacterium]